MCEVQMRPRAFGSSPGLDGQPYEVYHEGALFVAALLAQAMYMAPWPADLPLMLGPGLDLAVWIPKALASLRAAGLRPLQLPPCMRRLFGAIIGAIAGPLIEPQLSHRQTATRGGLSRGCHPRDRGKREPGRSTGSEICGMPRVSLAAYFSDSLCGSRQHLSTRSTLNPTLL